MGPDQKVWVSNEAREFGHWFTTNSQRNPDRERAMVKPAGVYRIATMGDSMAAAIEVAPENRFTSLLEKDLSDWVRLSTESLEAVEVLNFGIPASGTAEQWLDYRSQVIRYMPDLVLLLFLPANDIRNNSYELEVVQCGRPAVKPFFVLNDKGSLIPVNEDFYESARTRRRSFLAKRQGFRGIMKWLHENSILAHLMHRSYLRIFRNIRPGNDARNSREVELALALFDSEIQAHSETWQAAWSATAAILHAFAGEVSDTNTAFHTIIATGPFEIYRESRPSGADIGERFDWQLPNRRAEKILRDARIPYTNLFPEFRKVARINNQPLHFLHDGHYTKDGHRLIADHLLPTVKGYVHDSLTGRQSTRKFSHKSLVH